MLKENPDRVVVLFVGQIKPEISAVKNVADAAEAVQARINAPHWAGGYATFFLRDLPNRTLYAIEFKRVVVQILGFDMFSQKLSRVGGAIRLALEKLGSQTFSQVSLRVLSYLPLQMSHAEIRTLLTDSYLAKGQALDEICGPLDDVLLQFHGTKGKLKSKVVASPMTPEQVSVSLLAIGGWELFVEPKLTDTLLKDTLDNIRDDSLFMEIELQRDDCTPADISFFLTEALKEAERVTEIVVHRLKGKA